MTRKSYPSDVSDDEWAVVVPYLTLMREDTPQREHAVREVLNGLRYIVRTGMQWHMMPNDLPPWHAGDDPAAGAETHGIRLEVVKLPTLKRAFVLLPCRWVVERSFAWMTRFRRLSRDYERLAETLVGLHFVAFAILMAHRFVNFIVQSA
jgi:transposase